METLKSMFGVHFRLVGKLGLERMIIPYNHYRMVCSYYAQFMYVCCLQQCHIHANAL